MRRQENCCKAVLGINSVHYGIMMIFNLCIGTITPPVGYRPFLCGCLGFWDIYKWIRGRCKRPRRLSIYKVHNDSLGIVPIFFPENVDAAYMLRILFDLYFQRNIGTFIDA